MNSKTARDRVVDAALAGLDGVKWGDGEPYIIMAERYRRELAEAAAGAVAARVWLDAVDLWGGDDIIDAGHVACQDGGCNICILEDVAGLLGIPDAVIAQVLRRQADAGVVAAEAVE